MGCHSLVQGSSQPRDQIQSLVLQVYSFPSDSHIYWALIACHNKSFSCRNSLNTTSSWATYWEGEKPKFQWNRVICPSLPIRIPEYGQAETPQRLSCLLSFKGNRGTADIRSILEVPHLLPGCRKSRSGVLWKEQPFRCQKNLGLLGLNISSTFEKLGCFGSEYQLQSKGSGFLVHGSNLNVHQQRNW